MKYIDADRLRKVVKRLEKAAHKAALGCADREKRKFHEGKEFAYQRVVTLIDYQLVGLLIYPLLQEQPDFPTTDEQMKEFLATHPEIKVPEKYENPDWLFKKQEQPTKGYDPSYLNKCIAKASKTWENVDVDKYMDEVRGRDQEPPEVDLEKFTQKMNDWKARFNHPDTIPIKATMAFTARMFYQYPNVARQWYDSLPKATMD